MQSKSLIGFILPQFHDLHKEYLLKLIDLVKTKKLRIILDFGKNSSEGEFVGIENVVRGVQVC